MLLPLVRILIFRVARRWRWWNEPVVVIGSGNRAARAIVDIQQAGYLGYSPAGILSLQAHRTGTTIEGVPVWGDLRSGRWSGGAQDRRRAGGNRSIPGPCDRGSTAA